MPFHNDNNQSRLHLASRSQIQSYLRTLRQSKINFFLPGKAIIYFSYSILKPTYALPV